MQGQVELLALDLASSLTTLRPMGSYRLTLAGGAAPTLRLVTLTGGLQMTGSGQWRGTRLQFSGEAHTAPGREAVLAHLLNLIGRREGARSIITLG
jgi:general secretion pathway protein N